jgi:hypothetical protein
VASSDPFKPVLGDDIGPSGVQRARNGLSLVVFLIGLGILAAGVLGLAAVLVWAAFTAALG